MSILWKRGPMRVALLLLPAGALIATMLFVGFHLGGGGRAQADTLPGLDFSIGAGPVSGAQACDSSAGPMKCTFNPGDTLTLSFNLRAIPQAFSYSGYDSHIEYSNGLTRHEATIVQTGGVGVWPGCVFAAPSFGPGNVIAAGCAIGLPPAGPSGYTGVLYHIDMTCGASPSQETITLFGGDGNSDVADSKSVTRSEGTTPETLTINCGQAGGTNTPTHTSTPVVTNTPGGPTSTATPTRTPTHVPTATPTHGPRLLGDVNGDGNVNSIDAFFVLSFEAHKIAHLPLPENGDVNHDGMTNSLDALYILWIQAGLIAQP